MSDHTKAIVPIESWGFNSPELRAGGKLIDVGLLCEALLYYESAIINVANADQFSQILQWAFRQGHGELLHRLFAEGSLRVLDFAFHPAAVMQPNGSFFLANINDEREAAPNSFEARYFGCSAVKKSLRNRPFKRAIQAAIVETVIEVKAEEARLPTFDAIEDHKDPDRNALVIQSLVDELYRLADLPKPPTVAAAVTSPMHGLHTINWSVDFTAIAKEVAPRLNIQNGSPLVAGMLCNDILQVASRLSCDVYAGRPLSVLFGDKLYEGARKLKHASGIIETLKVSVEFPDVRSLVNSGKMGLNDIVKIRSKSKKFRDWLQSESDRDRDAIIAYHHDVAKESGWIRAGRKFLEFFGAISGTAIGNKISDGQLMGSFLGGAAGNNVGSAVGAGAQYLLELASSFRAGWRPVVFGTWLQDRIQTLVETKERQVLGRKSYKLGEIPEVEDDE